MDGAEMVSHRTAPHHSHLRELSTSDVRRVDVDSRRKLEMTSERTLADSFLHISGKTSCTSAATTSSPAFRSPPAPSFLPLWVPPYGCDRLHCDRSAVLHGTALLNRVQSRRRRRSSSLLTSALSASHPSVTWTLKRW